MSEEATNEACFVCTCATQSSDFPAFKIIGFVDFSYLSFFVSALSPRIVVNPVMGHFYLTQFTYITILRFMSKTFEHQKFEMSIIFSVSLNNVSTYVAG